MYLLCVIDAGVADVFCYITFDFSPSINHLDLFEVMFYFLLW